MFEFKQHNNLVGKHAILSPSKYHWVNYESDEQLLNMVRAQEASARGTRLHAFAAEAIRLGVYLNKRSNDPVNLYVNDAIKYKMSPEVTLVCSDNAFGTADAISFTPKGKHTGLLRIHDLKTGTTPASMTQLHLYAALFCLEYGFKPIDIDIETRIYQRVPGSDTSVLVDNPPFSDIGLLIDRIIDFDQRIDDWRATGEI